jgi:hypothetical protein
MIHTYLWLLWDGYLIFLGNHWFQFFKTSKIKELLVGFGVFSENFPEPKNHQFIEGYLIYYYYYYFENHNYISKSILWIFL